MPLTSTAAGARAASHGDAWVGHLGRIARGDEAAFAKLYDESSPLVYGVVMRMLANPADAEEVTVDVYHHVWRKAADFDAGRGNAASWLVMLARSRAIDYIRSRAARRRVEQPMPDDVHSVSSGGSVGPDPLGPDRQIVKQALSALSPDQRELIELAFYSGYTQSELAGRLDLPLGTVKTRMRSAMAKLRTLLEPGTGPLQGCVYGEGPANG